MFRDREVLARLDALEARLARIEARLDDVVGAEQLRAELRAKDEQVDALARQGLHVVELLDEARRELRQLKAGGGA